LQTFFDAMGVPIEIVSFNDFHSNNESWIFGSLCFLKILISYQFSLLQLH